MNKPEIVNAVAKRLGVTRARAAEITDLFFSQGGIIASELKRGGKVAISGFGHFELRRRAARAVKNPRTGTPLTINASIVPAFTAAQALKEIVNRKR